MKILHIALCAIAAFLLPHASAEQDLVPIWSCGGPAIFFTLPDPLIVTLPLGSTEVDAFVEIAERVEASVNCPLCPDSTVRCNPFAWVYDFQASIHLTYDPGDGTGNETFVFYAPSAKVECGGC